MKPDKREIAEQFGNAAEKYLRSSGHASGADLDILVEMASPHKDMLAVDVATGAGHTAAAIAPLVKTVLATDLSAGMLEQAQKLFASRQLPNVSVQLADAELLNLPQSTYDLVTCRIAAHHFTDVEQSLKSIARILKPGGLFVLEDTCAPADRRLDSFLNEMEQLRDCTHVRAYSQKNWLSMLAAAGFTVVETHIVRKTHDIAEWLARLNPSPNQEAAVYSYLEQAPAHAIEYFNIIFDAGKALSYTDDKILIASRRG